MIRHSLNPTWDEKLFFHVKRHEMTFTMCANIFDWDKLSSNDYVGECTLNMADLIAKAPSTDPETGLYRVDARTFQLEGDRLVEFDLPIEIAQKNELDATAGAGAATLHLRAKFTPYEALRQVFWRRYMSQYDTDDSGTMSYVELFSMLDSLGSTLSKRTIESFFTRFGKTAEDTLTEDEAVRCLEAELLKPREEKALVDSSTDSGMATPGVAPKVNPLESLADNARKPLSYTGPNAIPVESPGPEAVESLDLEPFEEPALQPPPSITTTQQQQHATAGVTPSRAASMDEMMDAAAADSVERVINISRCPLCHKDRISSRLEVDLVTHLAVCASQDWSSLDRIPVGNFVTASQAHRKWVTKVIGLVQNGQYQLGANSANIIVQDRRTGKLLEEKMQVYVRAGIRLLYKGLGSSRMEGQRIRRLLHSMSVKQGLKYDAPESVKDIAPFIAFHNLDLNEILDPIDSFKTFNEFFYRKLKPDARPVADPDEKGTLVSCADCRMMAFSTIGEATKVWIKGREFGVARLLGEKYGKEMAAYEGGALAIFRLAPQVRRLLSRSSGRGG